MSSPDATSSEGLPTRSRTLHGDFPPEVAMVEQTRDTTGLKEFDGKTKTPTPNRRRRRKSHSPSETAPLPAALLAPSDSARLGPWVLPLAILAAILLLGNFFVGRFFYQSGFSAGMQRALSADEPITPDDAAAIPQAKIFSAILNLRSSNLDRPTADLLTPIVLTALQSTPKESLPDYLRPGHSTVEDFAAAYVAMRLGDFGQAAAILRDADKKLPPDQFSFLMNDPALREFAREPRVMGFY